MYSASHTICPAVHAPELDAGVVGAARSAPAMNVSPPSTAAARVSKGDCRMMLPAVDRIYAFVPPCQRSMDSRKSRLPTRSRVLPIMDQTFPLPLPSSGRRFRPPCDTSMSACEPLYV